MIERDYILRMIRELGVVVARMMGFKESGQYEEALNDLDDAGEKYLGVPWKFSSSLSARQLIDLYGTARQPDRLIAAAELLREESGILERTGDSVKSIRQAMKSFEIFSALTAQEPNILSLLPREKYEALLGRILEYEPDSGLRGAIATYYILTDRIREAAEIAADGVAAGAYPAADAKIVYQQLLKLPDERLAREGFSRDEILRTITAISTKGTTL
jgi:hypothetical protein